MPRPLRIQFEGAMFHVFSRGNKNDAIFASQQDKECFLAIIANGAVRFAIDIYAFCIMDTHYHLLLQIKKTNLPGFMHYIGSSYANYLLSKGWPGHIFSGRYKAILVDREEYMLTVIRYIHLNPVEASIVKRPEEYVWSSYPYYLDKPKRRGKRLSWLNCGWVNEAFGGDAATAFSRFKEFTEAALGASATYPFEDLRGGVILGKEPFISHVLTMIKDYEPCAHFIERLLSRPMSIEELSQRIRKAFSLTDLGAVDYRRNYNHRLACDIFLFIAKESTCSSNREIADYLGSISCNAISCRYRDIKKRLALDRCYRAHFFANMNRV